MPALGLSLGLPFRPMGGVADGPPSVPTGFAATAQESEIDLSWDAQPEADTFEIYASTTNIFGTATQLTDAATGTSFTHNAGNGIQVGEKYYYWLRAINASGTSDWTAGSASTVTARSFATLTNTQSRVLTTPIGTWTLGTLFFGNSPDPLPNSISLSVGVNLYIHAEGDWYDANTEELANDVAISGTFTLANNSGANITVWNGEP